MNSLYHPYDEVPEPSSLLEGNPLSSNQRTENNFYYDQRIHQGKDYENMAQNVNTGSTSGFGMPASLQCPNPYLYTPDPNRMPDSVIENTVTSNLGLPGSSDATTSYQCSQSYDSGSYVPPNQGYYDPGHSSYLGGANGGVLLQTPREIHSSNTLDGLNMTSTDNQPCLYSSHGDRPQHSSSYSSLTEGFGLVPSASSGNNFPSSSYNQFLQPPTESSFNKSTVTYSMTSITGLNQEDSSISYSYSSLTNSQHTDFTQMATYDAPSTMYPQYSTSTSDNSFLSNSSQPTTSQSCDNFYQPLSSDTWNDRGRLDIASGSSDRFFLPPPTCQTYQSLEYSQNEQLQIESQHLKPEHSSHIKEQIEEQRRELINWYLRLFWESSIQMSKIENYLELLEVNLNDTISEEKDDEEEEEEEKAEDAFEKLTKLYKTYDEVHLVASQYIKSIVDPNILTLYLIGPKALFSEDFYNDLPEYGRIYFKSQFETMISGEQHELIEKLKETRSKVQEVAEEFGIPISSLQ